MKIDTENNFDTFTIEATRTPGGRRELADGCSPSTEREPAR